MLRWKCLGGRTWSLFGTSKHTYMYTYSCSFFPLRTHLFVLAPLSETMGGGGHNSTFGVTLPEVLGAIRAVYRSMPRCKCLGGRTGLGCCLTLPSIPILGVFRKKKNTSAVRSKKSSFSLVTFRQGKPSRPAMFLNLLTRPDPTRPGP